MGTPEEQKKPVRSGIFEEIENFVTAGYGRKEDLRALDKSLRERYYSELMGIRHRWEKVYLRVLDTAQPSIGRECKTAIQTIDRLAATVNRAEYGYAPLFDRVKKVQEKTLDSVLEHDRGLAEALTQLSNDVANAEASLKASAWATLGSLVDTLNEDLRTFEDKWNKRKQVMNS